MLILVTGGTGFVGRHVFQQLLHRGVAIRAVVREGKREGLTGFSRKIDIITTEDLFSESKDWLANACQGAHTVLHLAWYAEHAQYLKSGKNLDCAVGTLRLAQAATSAGIKRFVGIGTCFEYDLNQGVLRPDGALRPSTPYGGAKAGTFLSLSSWLPTCGVEFAWCRLFYLYGDGEDGRRLVPYLRSRLSAGLKAELSSGQQVRDYLDVREAARMIVDITLSAEQGEFNVCSGIPTTIRELAERIADEYGRRDLLQFGARPDNPTDPLCVVGLRREVPC